MVTANATTTISAALILGAMVHAKIEPSAAETTRRPHAVLHRYTVPVVGLDPAHDGLRIAHLSDPHVGSLTSHRFICDAVEMAQAETPDLVLDRRFRGYSPKYVPLLGGLVRGFAVPTVCVLGNHDYWTDGHGVTSELLREQYTALLRNQHTRIQVRSAPLTIVGVDDAVTRQGDVQRAFSAYTRPTAASC